MPCVRPRTLHSPLARHSRLHHQSGGNSVQSSRLLLSPHPSVPGHQCSTQSWYRAASHQQRRQSHGRGTRHPGAHRSPRRLEDGSRGLHALAREKHRPPRRSARPRPRSDGDGGGGGGFCMRHRRSRSHEFSACHHRKPARTHGPPAPRPAHHLRRRAGRGRRGLGQPRGPRG